MAWDKKNRGIQYVQQINVENVEENKKNLIMGNNNKTTTKTT